MKLSIFSIHFFQIYFTQNVLSKKGTNMMMVVTINASPATWETNILTMRTMMKTTVFVWIASIHVTNFMKWNMSGTVVSTVIVEIKRRKKESVTFQKVFVNLETIEKCQKKILFWNSWINFYYEKGLQDCFTS